MLVLSISIVLLYGSQFGDPFSRTSIALLNQITLYITQLNLKIKSYNNKSFSNLKKKQIKYLGLVVHAINVQRFIYLGLVFFLCYISRFDVFPLLNFPLLFLLTKLCP
jgi:hypothetical protein